MPGKMPNSRTIHVDMIARVEGEGALHVVVQDGQVQDLQLRIFEPPRFFEAFLKGRSVHEVPDIVARICGICPVAYQMSAVHALESIFGITLDGTLRMLRRLLYCAEWIESHTLHVYLLHAPDFLGYESGLEMAKEHADVVKRGLRIKKAGNQLLALLGGRSVHPVSVKVGGFTRVPGKQEFAAVREELLWARDAAIETVKWVTGFEFADPEHDYTFVSLRSERDYPMNEGLVASNRGLAISPREFETHFIEKQVPYSNALHCSLDGQAYFAGPLARLHLNAERLSPLTKQVMADRQLCLPFSRASQGIIARALEILHAIDEALRLIDQYEPPLTASVPVHVVTGEGMAVTEAPRGLLYHRYRVDEDGTIQQARIIPPTSQNQRRIEEDLRAMLPASLHLTEREVAHACERIIRHYDPCISCATHFLKIHLDRRPDSGPSCKDRV